MLRALFIALPLVLVGACGDDGGDAPKDAPMGDAPPMAPDASCFDQTNSHNPPTYEEIINACTTADKIFTDHPKPPLQKSDGSLPPLPP